MTLEQIKNRQTSLNEYLSQVLQESENTVDFIAGEKDEKADGEILMKSPNGLLEELHLQQDKTEKLINHLSNNQNRLSTYVYTPVQCENSSYIQ